MEKKEDWRDGRGPQPFRFKASWLEEEQCRGVVAEAWEMAVGGSEGKVMEALKGVAASLQNWSTNILGDLEKRLKKAKKRS